MMEPGTKGGMAALLLVAAIGALSAVGFAAGWWLGSVIDLTPQVVR